ncbi:MAG: thiamine phosphate synthase [Phycisphaerales bacterium JB039]
MPPDRPVSSEIARMVDACANRAREAARTLEDVARFVLCDQRLTGRLKEIRHELTGALGAIDPGVRRAWRQTSGDVGTGLSTAAERARAGLGPIVEAAGARLGEALRSIEEALKTVDAGAAARIERLRYLAYDAARDVRLGLGTGRGRPWRLCVLLTEAACVCPWEVVAEAAISAGADCVQLREKGMSDRELLARARRLVEVARAGPAGPAAVIINDRPDIALLAGADGAHLGQTDMAVRDVRRLAGFSLLVGVSCATPEDAQRAARDGADYLGLGPMFASGTKPKPALAGPALIEAICADAACARLPHLAISGIDAGNVAELARVGCRGVAVCAAVCGARDPGAATASLLACLDAGA